MVQEKTIKHTYNKSFFVNKTNFQALDRNLSLLKSKNRQETEF